MLRCSSPHQERMSTQQDNKLIVDRWLVAFWGERYDEDAAIKLESDEMTLVYSLYERVRGQVYGRAAT